MTNLLFTVQLLLLQSAPGQVPVNDFSPAVFFAFLILGAVFLMLLGIGVAVGIFMLLLVVAGLSFGLLSASVLVGYLNKSVATGFRTFVLIVSSLLGVPVGIFSVVVLQSLQNQPLNFQEIIVPGGLVGSIGGFVTGVLFMRLIMYLKTRVESRYSLH